MSRRNDVELLGQTLKEWQMALWAIPAMQEEQWYPCPPADDLQVDIL
jgi:hypothetical protein